MKQVRLLYMAIFLMVAVSFALVGNAKALTQMEELGEKLYFDGSLSQPGGQSCASCHDPAFGFVDPDAELPVSEGVLPNRFGNRNSPAAGYAMYAPTFHFDEAEELWIGGQFWDGRATGEVLGDPLADQALGPFLNPVEMANKSKDQVVRDVRNSSYAALFEEVWGPRSLNNTEAAYEKIALSIAGFERTALFAPFNSKYDLYLQLCLDVGGEKNDCAQGRGNKAEGVAVGHFTAEEWRGFQLFMGSNNNDGVLRKKEGAMCSACHIADWTPAASNVVVPSWSPDGSVPPMFTDFTFDNLGVPKNVEYPLSATSPPDFGLGPISGNPDDNGKFKVMSLRNIGMTGPYAHNGLFKTLKEITHFYNTRDVPGAGWADPEYPATINNTELGNLGLSDADEDSIASFMMTLSDQ